MNNNTTTGIWYHFFIFMCIEIFLMGSGQELQVAGPVTLRMINFGIAALIGVLFLTFRKMPETIFFITFYYTMLICFSASFGFLWNADTEYIFIDIKMFLALFAFPYFYFVINSEDVVKKVYSTFIGCLKVLIIVHLVFIVIVYIMRIIPFELVYSFLDQYDSFRFRGNEGVIFYKGFLFIPIASVAFIIEKKYVWFILSVISIYFTFTRGFYVVFLLGMLLNYIMSKRFSLGMVIGLLVLAVITYSFINFLGIFEVPEERSDGDAIRILTIEQVINEISPFSFMFGHGLGHGVPVRPEHMEMSFLEIFHKQGLMGLVFWAILLVRVFRYRNHTCQEFEKYTRFFVIALLLVYVQSLFNPYITNAIGISMVLLSYLSCYRLCKIKSNENTLCYCAV